MEWFPCRVILCSKRILTMHKRICNFKANATRASVAGQQRERMRASNRAMMWQFFNSIFIVFPALLWQAKENTSVFVVVVSAVVVVVCCCCLLMLSKCLKSALVVAKHETHFINLSPFPAPLCTPPFLVLPLSVSGFFFVRCIEVFPFVCARKDDFKWNYHNWRQGTQAHKEKKEMGRRAGGMKFMWDDFPLSCTMH